MPGHRAGPIELTARLHALALVRGVRAQPPRDAGIARAARRAADDAADTLARSSTPDAWRHARARALETAALYGLDDCAAAPAADAARALARVLVAHGP